MSIWKYDVYSHRIGPELLESPSCVFCLTKSLRQLGNISYQVEETWAYVEAGIEICDVCGWWKANGVLTRPGGRIHNPDLYHWRAGAIATLKRLNLSDVSIPIQQVKDRLVAKFGDVERIPKRTMEFTTANIFEDFGYRAVVTAYQKDNGIDVFLSKGDQDGIIGVQVKSTRNAIGVEQIREFYGALHRNDCLEGIFVTTSRFTGPAVAEAELFSTRKATRIDLMDASRLFEALSIQRTPSPKTVDEFVAFNGKHELKTFGEVTKE